MEAAVLAALRDPRGLGAALVVLVLVLYGMSVGRTRALISLLSIYVAYTLAILFPFSQAVSARLPERFQLYAHAGLFLGAYVLAFLILSSAVRHGRLSMGELSLWQVGAISLVQVGLLVSMSLLFIDEPFARAIVGRWYVFFAGTSARWAWPAASLAILPLLRREHTE
ncbi:MAG: hypothetical protein IT406_01325 [Candidatus Yanofskybacteria bacterium]|nr:hypothetical protein [Candidatus Yanofskybacteria bacterium]